MPEQCSLFRLSDQDFRYSHNCHVFNLKNVPRAVAFSDMTSVESFVKSQKIGRSFQYGQKYTQTQGHDTISTAYLKRK